MFIKDKPIKCIVHIVDNHYENLLDKVVTEINYHSKLTTKVKSKSENRQMNIIDLKTFNLFENSAKLLFRKKPIYENLEINSDDSKGAHLVILGFGQAGRQVFLEAIKRAHFPNGKKIHITVIDRNAHLLESNFKLRYPNIIYSCTTNFVQYDVNTVEFYEFMLSIQSSVTYIASCFDNDELDYISVSNLMKQFSDIPIAVRLTKDLNVAHLLEQDNEDYHNIVPFGALAEISSENIIIGEKLDEFAKAIHNQYKNINSNARSWDELDRFTKNSNIAQANHIDTKLYAMGLKRISKQQEGFDARILSEAEYLEHVNEHVEKLARAEHERWNAYHFANGWSVQPATLPKSKNLINKTHCCLVSWDELDKVSSIRSKIEQKEIDYKSYDREYIVNLYSVLDSVGYHVTK